MSALCTLLLMLLFLRSTFGSGQSVSTTVINNTKMSCNETIVKELDKCWNNLPVVNFLGMPSSVQEIEKACSVFISGMECVDTWSRICLSKEGQQKIVGSVFGALQIYDLLCTDATFREDYLKHAACYRKISPVWNNCNTKFINTLQKVDHSRDTLSLCCIRRKYTECVFNVTKVLCSTVANKYLQSIHESLIHSPLPEYHSSRCVDVEQRNCSRSSSAASCTKATTMSRFPFFIGMLSPLNKGILAIVGMLQMRRQGQI